MPVLCVEGTLSLFPIVSVSILEKIVLNKAASASEHRCAEMRENHGDCLPVEAIKPRDVSSPSKDFIKTKICSDLSRFHCPLVELAIGSLKIQSRVTSPE